MMWHTVFGAAACALAMILGGAPAQASFVRVNFEGVLASGTVADTIGGYFDGGTTGLGRSGPDLGLSFGTAAYGFCMTTSGVYCSNISRGGRGDPASQYTSLYFARVGPAFLNVEEGFGGRFAFHYTALDVTGHVRIYDGPDGTGELRATLVLPDVPERCGAEFMSVNYCPFVPVETMFDGVARSISFNDARGVVFFDDLEFGIPTIASVPLPPALPALASAIGLMAVGRRTMRRR